MTESQPPTPPQPPLEYWHATGPQPLHPALLTLCTFAGVFIGSALGFGIVSAISIPTLMHGNGIKLPLIVGCITLLGGVGFVVLVIRKIVKGSRLTLELRRRGPRFFVIGLLIGCGVACLLEGICFTGIGLAGKS